MGFNPLHERGIPLERQFRNWSDLNVAPFDTRNVDPYTRCRVIFMNGIEVEAIINSHQFNRHTADTGIKQNLAMVRRVEQQQQKAVNCSFPATRARSPIRSAMSRSRSTSPRGWLARSPIHI